MASAVRTRVGLEVALLAEPDLDDLVPGVAQRLQEGGFVLVPFAREQLAVGGLCSAASRSRSSAAATSSWVRCSQATKWPRSEGEKRRSEATARMPQVSAVAENAGVRDYPSVTAAVRASKS